MDNSQAARPYAAAAFAHAREHNTIDEWNATLRALADAVSAIYAVVRGRRLIADKILATAAEEISTRRLDDGQRNFLSAVADSGRLSLLPRITDMYEELRLAHDGVVRVRVETAMPMGIIARRGFNETLEKWLVKTDIGGKALVEYEETPALIGGVRVYVRDDVLDASILGRLNEMKQTLNAGGV